MAMEITATTNEEEEARLGQAPPIKPVAPDALSPFTARYFKLNAAADAVIKEVGEVPGVSDAANIQFNFVRDSVDREVAGSETRVDAALNNIDTINRFGRVGRSISAIIGLFDPDFDVGQQKRNLTREQIILQRQKGRLSRAGTRRAQLINQATTEATSAKTIFTINQQGFVDAIRAQEHGQTIEDNVRKDTLNFITDQDLSTLRGYQADESTIPKTALGAAVRKAPGLLQAAINQKVAVKHNVDIQAATVESLARSSAIEDFNETIETEAQLDSLIKNEGPFPPHVTLLDVIELKEKHVRARNTITQIGLATVAQEFQLVNVLKADFLLARSETELKSFLVKANEKGSNRTFSMTTKSGIEISFSTPELKAALAKREKINTDAQRLASENAAASSGVRANLLGLDARKTALLRANDMDSSTPSGEFISMEDLATNNRRDARIEAAASQVAATEGLATQAAAITVLNEEVVAGMEEIDKQIKSITDNMPDEVKQGALEYANTGTMSKNNAASIVAFNAFDSLIFNDNDVFAAAGKLFSDEMQLLAPSKSTTIDFSGDALKATSGTRDLDSKVEEALQNSEFREKSIGTAKILSMSKSINQLAAQLGAPQAPSQEIPGGELGQPDIDLNPFIKLLNPRTGLLAPKFFNETGAFDMSVFLTEAAKLTVPLVRAGVLSPGETVADMIFDLTRTNSPDIMRAAGMGLASAAMMKRAFGGANSATRLLYESIDVSSSLVPQSMVVAQQNAAVLDRELEIRLAKEEEGEQRGRGAGAGRTGIPDRQPLFPSAVPGRGGRLPR